MKSHNEQNQHLHTDTTVAVSRVGFQRGDAVGVDYPSRRSAVRRESKPGLQFFVGEVLGLFFIALTAAYIFVMPVALTKPGALTKLMNSMIKRIIDITGAIVGLILTAPLWLVIPVLIKLDSPGPVFYRQTRVGVNRRRRDRRYHQRADMTGENRRRDRRKINYLGKPFEVIKFRTMVNDAEKKSGPVWATKNDPRVTRLGSILRKSRIDEIPQFINILKGDMALVGPRPERPNFVLDLSEKVDNYRNRLDVKPGLTGLAQVENGYDSSVASVVEKVRFDLQYIRDWSVVQDIKIIMKTFVVVVTGKGAC